MADASHFRHHERRPVRLPASLRRDDGSLVRALLLDLSLAGAGLEVTDPLTPGTSLLVEVTSPTLWDPLPLRSEVVWFQASSGRQPGRAGVRFSPDNGPHLFALFEVLAAHAFEE